MSLNEARYTKPSDECPNPDRWTSTDSDSTEQEVSELVAGFIRGLQPQFVVETGSAYGQTSKLIGEALQTNGHGRLVTLEVDACRVNVTRARCTGLPVTVLQMSSLKYQPEAQIDFAFFDSLFHLRPLELKLYLPYMTERTVVGFHDTGSQHPVRDSLDVLVAEGLIAEPLYLPTPRGVCFTRVGLLR